MRFNIVLYIGLFYLPVLNAQTKIFNNWYFGENAAITFNSGVPEFINFSNLMADEGCASVSDEDGSLLFYTNGKEVYDKNNYQMPNGYGLKAHLSATHGAFIVPYPLKPNLYYLFTVDAEAGGYANGCGCFMYSLIDMSLNSGAGDVSSKNIFVCDTVTEKVSAVNHANDSCVWVITHKWNSSKFLSYLITPSGINANPVVSDIGGVHTGTPINCIGQMKVSPDGKKLGCCITYQNKIELFDFNDSTGKISNPIQFTTSYNYPYGFEFSPDSKLIYVAGATIQSSCLVQYGIKIWNKDTIIASEHQIDFSPLTYGQLQLGPDNKIYVACWYEQFLNVVNKPNLTGTQCYYTKQAVNLYNNDGEGYCVNGLPNRISNYKGYVSSVNTSDTLCEPYIPNVISPNNDKINDAFTIICNKRSFIPTDLIIYNRWGLEVYNKKQLTGSLDKIPDGVYFYIFSLYEKSYRGVVTLFH